MRVGVLTSGGDCQALNATMRGFIKGLYNYDSKVEVIGFKNGYKGLMNSDYQKLTLDDVEEIINVGGTILGSSRCPFKMMEVIEDGYDKVAHMIKTYQDRKLDCLCILGGNGSVKTANLLSQKGLNVIALPKTIDNDTYGTDYTFGFQSAIDVASRYLDEIKSTAKSHSRVFVVEIMGHKVGHICLQAGIASGVDAILIPEIPYSIDSLVKVIKDNEKKGKNYTIIAVAEGAKTKEEYKLTKKEYKKIVAKRNGMSVVYDIAKELESKTDKEIRVSVAGHIQRGGQPCSYDKMISSLFGVAGAKLVKDKDFGKLIVLKNNNIESIPLSESAGIIKYVETDGQAIKLAKRLGISFGD